jgi:hypothetical protein
VCVLIVAALHCIFRNLRTWPAESWDAWGAPSAACNAGNGATAPLAPMPGWLGKMCESGHQNLKEWNMFISFPLKNVVFCRFV